MSHEPNVTLFPVEPKRRMTPAGKFWLSYIGFLILVGAAYWWLVSR